MFLSLSLYIYIYMKIYSRLIYNVESLYLSTSIAGIICVPMRRHLYVYILISAPSLSLRYLMEPPSYPHPPSRTIFEIQ